MSKQYAHLHTMAKTSVKFQNDWPKTVGGVINAHTKFGDNSLIFTQVIIQKRR